MKYFLVFFFCAASLLAKAQTDTVKVTPIDALASVDSTSWLENNFAPLLISKKVVGLGEVCHGGHEPFALKAQLMRYLITQQGYRQLLIETADITLRDLNNYLTNDNTALSIKVIDSLFTRRARIMGARSPLDAEEIKSIFVWLKSYNLSHPGEKVSVRGMDMSGINYNYFRTKYFSKLYLKRVQQEFGTGSISASQAEKILRQWDISSRDSLEKTYTADQMANLKMDLLDFYNLIRYQSGGGEKSSTLMTLRDSIMAANAIKLINDKTIIWAHNTHVANSGFNSGLFHAKMLGNFLHEKFGSSYFIALTDFSYSAQISIKSAAGIFNPQNFDSNKRSLAFQIAKKEKKAEGWVLAQNLNKWKMELGYNSIGAGGAQNFVPCSIHAFDVLLFVKDIHPSTVIN